MPLFPPVTMATLPFRLIMFPPSPNRSVAVSPGRAVFFPTVLPQPFEKMIANANGVRHRGQSRIHRADAREEAGVDHIQIIQLMRLAISVEHRRPGVFAETDRPRLVRHASHIDL